MGDIKKKIAYIIPLVILLYVLYMNFLPFGFSKTFVLDVGKEDSDDIYLIDNQFLGPPEMYDGKYFRRINGTVEVVLDTHLTKKNNKKIIINVELESDNDVFLKIDDLTYPIYLNDIDKKYLLKTEDNISVYGKTNSTLINNLIKSHDNSFFNFPKFFFLVEDNSTFLDYHSIKEDEFPFFHDKLILNKNFLIEQELIEEVNKPLKVKDINISKKMNNGFLIKALVKNDYIDYHSGIIYKKDSFLLSAPYDSYRFSFFIDNKLNTLSKDNAKLNKINLIFIEYDKGFIRLYFNNELIESKKIRGNINFSNNNQEIYLKGRGNKYEYKGDIYDLQIFDLNKTKRFIVKNNNDIILNNISNIIKIIPTDSAKLYNIKVEFKNDE